MIKTSYQVPELRNANDEVVQEGAFGKNTALSNSTNDGWIDYVMNDLEALHDTIGDSAATLDGNGHVVEPCNLAIGDEDGNRLKTSYLKLTGGTVAGTLNVQQNLVMQDNQENVFGGLYVPASSASSQFLDIYGGDSATSSYHPRIRLFDATDGRFLLYSTDGATNYTLVGGSDGTLRWRGNILAYDSQCVHSTGNENISGTKIFTTSISTHSAAVNTITIIDDNLERGQTRTGSRDKWLVRLYDKNTVPVAGVDNYVTASNVSRTALVDYPHNDAGANYDYIAVGHDGNGNVYTYAPTPAQSSNDSNIATTAYVTSKAANYFPLTGGNLTGNIIQNCQSFASYSYQAKYGGITKGNAPSSNKGAHPFSIMDENGTFINGLYYGLTSTGVSRFGFSSSWGSSSRRVWLEDNGTTGVNLGVSVDNVIALGTSSARWKQLFAGTTTIATSDERLKENIAPIDDNVLDAWGEIGWVQYQFKDAVAEKGDSARIHTGAIAQRIESVFTAHGLDANRYGLLCYDEWNATPAERDENGNITEPAKPAGNRYSLRYEEALCMEAAYQRRRADRLEARIEALERVVNHE